MTLMPKIANKRLFNNPYTVTHFHQKSMKTLNNFHILCIKNTISFNSQYIPVLIGSLKGLYVLR